MQAELLMIGTELLLGQIEDTNAARMARTLAEYGIPLYQKTTVGDNAARIQAALRDAAARAGAVLCSGGLGPTEDDITRECVAEVAGVPLEYHEELYEAIKNRYLTGRKNIPRNNRKQAMIPRGAHVLDNPNGTAPGFILEMPRKNEAGGPAALIACMPGVPHELDAMLGASVLPFLQARFGLQGIVHSRVLKACGIGESRVDLLIGDLIRKQKNPTIGLLASPEAVRIRIAARAENIAAANALIAPVEAAVRDRLDGGIMGADGDTLEGVLDQLLTKRGWTLAIAEIGTTGLVAHRLAAAGEESFASGQVSRQDPQDAASAEEHAVDISRRLLLQSRANCTLVLIMDRENENIFGHFHTPSGVTSWRTAVIGTGVRNYQRYGIIAMEHMRRFLTDAGNVGLTR